MDISSFRNRVGLTQAQLAEKLELATSSVGNLCSNTKKPSYEVIERLLVLGARLDEVFSPEIQEIVLRNAMASRSVPKDVYESDEFKDGVKLALMEMISEGTLPEKIIRP